jgi:hypothetical protein
MTADRTAALARAQKMVSAPKTYKADNLNMARELLKVCVEVEELRKLADAVVIFPPSEPGYDYAVKTLREFLERTK